MTFFGHIFEKFPENWAKCGKNNPFFDKCSLKQGPFSLPELPKRGGVKNASHPGTKPEGVPPGSEKVPEGGGAMEIRQSCTLKFCPHLTIKFHISMIVVIVLFSRWVELDHDPEAETGGDIDLHPETDIPKHPRKNIDIPQGVTLIPVPPLLLSE